MVCSTKARVQFCPIFRTPHKCSSVPQSSADSSSSPRKPPDSSHYFTLQPLNLTIDVDWRPWLVDGQIAGYTVKYSRDDAFRLTYATVKRLVLSLATDKAVWDAVLKNEFIQKLRGSPCTVNYERLQRSNEEPDLAATIWRCIMDAAKEKVIELVEKFLSLVNELFQPAELEKPASGNKEQTDEKVRSSFLLAILILIIVVVTRVQNV